MQPRSRRAAENGRGGGNEGEDGGWKIEDGAGELFAIPHPQSSILVFCPLRVFSPRLRASAVAFPSARLESGYDRRRRTRRAAQAAGPQPDEHGLSSADAAAEGAGDR